LGLFEKQKSEFSLHFFALPAWAAPFFQRKKAVLFFALFFLQSKKKCKKKGSAQAKNGKKNLAVSVKRIEFFEKL
jgi:hypothetical protein